MGIINATPDSFSDGGRYLSPQRALEAALAMEEAGACLIDVGGESTRPGSQPVSAEEEGGRVLPVIELLASRLSTPISVDTSKSQVAERALDGGAALVNDVSAGLWDPAMLETVARHRAGIILMHTPARPETMMENTDYQDVVGQVAEFLDQRCLQAERCGVDPEAIAVDPGIGFGKTTDQNLSLIHAGRRLVRGRRPLVVGLSRKRFIGEVYAIADAEGRDPASAEAACLAVAHGADLIRTHNVRLTAAALKVAQQG